MKNMDFLTRIVETKREEVKAASRIISISEMRIDAEKSGPKRPFEAVLEKPGIKGANIIAEIKRASPSKGLIRADLDPTLYARAYEKGGAAAISVLTDQTYFKGNMKDLILARNAVSIPVLRKEFIVSEYQIYEACAAGADAVLLIVRILDAVQLADYVQLCREIGLGALVEIHDMAEIETAVKAGAKRIGINNRDLSSFNTDIGIAARTAALLGPDQVPVAASGITCREDIRRMKEAGIFNFLIGESIVRAKNPKEFLESLF